MDFLEKIIFEGNNFPKLCFFSSIKYIFTLKDIYTDFVQVTFGFLSLVSLENMY